MLDYHCIRWRHGIIIMFSSYQMNICRVSIILNELLHNIAPTIFQKIIFYITKCTTNVTSYMIMFVLNMI